MVIAKSREDSPHFVASPERTKQSHMKNCHYEERSEARQSSVASKARQSLPFYEIATRPSVVRNDKAKAFIALVLLSAAQKNEN
jgi:hypothetical protein